MKTQFYLSKKYYLFFFLLILVSSCTKNEVSNEKEDLALLKKSDLINSTTILYSSFNEEGFTDLFLKELNKETSIQLTNNPGHDFWAMFSNNGKKIIYSAFIGETREIYLMDSDGSNKINITDDLDAKAWYPLFSPNGKKISIISDRDGYNDVYVMNLDGSELTNVSNDDMIHSYGYKWSPNSKKIAYSGIKGDYFYDYSRDSEVYTVNYDGTERKNVSNSPDTWDSYPLYTPNGKKIVFERISALNNTWDDDVIIMNSDGTNQIDLSQNDDFDWPLEISPNGKKILCGKGMDADDYQLFIMNIDGTEKEILTDKGGFYFSSSSWSKNSQFIYYADKINYQLIQLNISTKEETSFQIDGELYYILDQK